MVSDEQLKKLIDFSMVLDFKAKKRWRSYLPYLKGDMRERFYHFLSEEKARIVDTITNKLKGFRGYYFIRNLEIMEKEFLNESFS